MIAIEPIVAVYTLIIFKNQHKLCLFLCEKIYLLNMCEYA